MRFWRVLSSLILFFGIPAFAYDCNVAVQDPAFVLEKGQPQILSAIQTAANKGADVKIIATNEFSGTGEQLANQMNHQCPNWQSVNGGVKNNLIFISLFPRKHEIGLFVGSEFGKVINTSEIKSDYMIPAFRDGDFVRGVVNGVNQISTQIEGFHTAPLHGTTVIKQATDLKGLWTFMYIALELLSLAGLIWLVFFLVGKRKQRIAAQQRAVNARNNAAQFALEYPDSKGTELFTRMNNSETYNPDTPGLSTEAYDTIAAAYKNLVFVPVSTKTKTYYDYVGYPEAKDTTPINTQPIPTSTSENSTTVINNTTVVDSTPYVPYIPPVIVEETYTSPSPNYSSRDNDYGSSSSSDSGSSWSDSSSSSSSSSWSDSSSSSSWSDSSSSSSWSDSGSSSSGGDSSW